MSRPLRIELPDGLYHVTNRGLERRKIVRDDTDRATWYRLLDRTVVRRRWRVLAWALMENHFHLFLRTPDADLSAGMHDLQSGYASFFNVRHTRRGPLFQSRFRAVLVEAAAHDWELTRYVHLNPVRAGLAARPEDYPWSSARHYLSSRGAPKWLAWQEVLAQHGRTIRTARRAYAHYLAEGLATGPVSPLKDVVASTLLGSDAFVERVREWARDRLPDRDVPAARELRAKVTLEAVEAVVCDVFGVEPEQLHRPRQRGNDARATLAYLARRWTAIPAEELGNRLGGVSGAAISQTVAKVTDRLCTDSALRARARACESALPLDV